MQTVDVLIKPVLSEKAVSRASQGQYAFSVQSAASKQEIKKAVERFYQVEVVKVTTAQFPTNPRRQTNRRVTNPGTICKKAYVTLKAGQTLNLLEVEE